MNMDKKIFGIIFLVISIFCFTATFAETIVLKSGKTIEGRIIEETDKYIKLETAPGKSSYFNKNKIDIIKGGNEAANASSKNPGLKKGLSDSLVKGYTAFVTKEISTSSAILICLPGSGTKTKQDMDNWAFAAGRKGFAVLGLDVDYSRIQSLKDMEQLYSSMSDIIRSFVKGHHMKKYKLYLVGTSAGGIMSIALTLHYPGKFTAVGVVSGASLMFGAQEELQKAKGSHFYMVHGDKDEKIPLQEFQSTIRQLEKNGAIIEPNIIPEGLHNLNSDVYNGVVNWLSDLDNLLKR